MASVDDPYLKGRNSELRGRLGCVSKIEAVGHVARALVPSIQRTQTEKHIAELEQAHVRMQDL